MIFFYLLVPLVVGLLVLINGSMSSEIYYKCKGCGNTFPRFVFGRSPHICQAWKEKAKYDWKPGEIEEWFEKKLKDQKEKDGKK